MGKTEKGELYGLGGGMWRRQDVRLGRGFAAGMIVLMYCVTGCVTAPTYQVAGAPPTIWPPLAVPPALSASSACAQPPSVQQAPPSPSPSATEHGAALLLPQMFPPQSVVVTGNYAEFISANEQRLQSCREKRDGCDAALFNLGFAHAYADSPYRNLRKAAAYFEALLTQYPKSLYAVQGKVWRALILERLALENDLRSVQTTLRGKDDTIRTLQEQIQRLREQEIDMQEKERELLRLR